MINFRKCLTFVILCSIAGSLQSADFLHQIVNGNLTGSWQIMFSMFVEDLKGVLLRGFDCNGNWLEIRVLHNKDGKSVHLKFNSAIKPVSMTQLCGCSSCDDRKVTFNISFAHYMVKVSCNGQDSETLNANEKRNALHHKDSEYATCQELKSVINITKKILFFLGNIGPFSNVTTTTLLPLKDQMSGCLDTFKFNENEIQFKAAGQRFLSQCPNRCHENQCSGGVCIERLYNISLCDCSNTERNGRFCNRSMKYYIPGTNNSYVKTSLADIISVKMTWRVRQNREYCLMEIMGKSETVTITSDNGYLVVGNKTVALLNDSVINFFNVTITNNHLTIKTKKNRTKIDFSLVTATRINIGFSKTKMTCKTFEGDYDLSFDTLMIQPIVPNLTRVTQEITTKHTHSSIMIKQKKRDNLVIIILPIIVGCFVIFALLIALLYLKNQRDMMHAIEQLTQERIFRPRTGVSKTSTESGEYAKVNDNNIYDYIRACDVYMSD